MGVHPGDISEYVKTVVTMGNLLLILIFISYGAFVGATNTLAFGFGGKNRRALFTAYTVLCNWISSLLNPVFYCLRLGEICQAVMKSIFKQNQ